MLPAQLREIYMLVKCFQDKFLLNVHNIAPLKRHNQILLFLDLV